MGLSDLLAIKNNRILKQLVPENLQNVSAQLASKANLSDLSELVTAKPKIVEDISGMTDTGLIYVLKNTMEIYYWVNGVITPSGKYYNEALWVDGSITPSKVSFMVRNASKNKFDKNSTEIQPGKAMTNTGVVVSNVNFSLSHKIPCKYGDTVFLSKSVSSSDMTRVLYAESGATIYAFSETNMFLGYADQLGHYSVPVNTSYVIFSFWSTYISTINRNLQLEIAEAMSLTYEEYYDNYSMDTSYIEDFVEQKAKEISNPSREIVIPSRLYGVVGKKFNVFYDNIILHGNASSLNIYNTSVDVLQSFEKFAKLVMQTAGIYSYRFVLSGQYSKYTSLYAYDYTDIIKDGQVRIAAADAGNGVTKKAMFIGDSITNFGYYESRLKVLFDNDVMNLEMLGTIGETGAKHEGRSGWSAVDYTTKASYNGFSNAFWNSSTSAFDFSNYMSTQGYTGVDYVFINLGTNDISKETQLTIIPAWQKMIDSIKVYNPNIKIFLWCLPMPCQMSYNQAKKDLFLTMKKLIIDNFGDPTHAGNGIYVYDVGCSLDTLNDFNYTNELVSEFGTETYKKPTDDIHPAYRGFEVIADMIFAVIKYAVANY